MPCRRRARQRLRGCMRLPVDRQAANADVAAAGSADYQDISGGPSSSASMFPCTKHAEMRCQREASRQPYASSNCGILPAVDKGVLSELHFNATLSYPAMGASAGAIASESVGVRVGDFDSTDIAEVTAVGPRWQGSPALTGAWTEIGLGFNPCTGVSDQGYM